jgi:hypothetical protein
MGDLPVEAECDEGAAGPCFRHQIGDERTRLGRLHRCIQISSRNAIAAYAEFGPYGAANAAQTT